MRSDVSEEDEEFGLRKKERRKKMRGRSWECKEENRKLWKRRERKMLGRKRRRWRKRRNKMRGRGKEVDGAGRGNVTFSLCVFVLWHLKK